MRASRTSTEFEAKVRHGDSMINTPARATLQLRDDAIAQLLLLTSKPDLSTDQLNIAESLAHRISDWGSFTKTAIRKFSVPYAYSALRQINENAVPVETLHDLQRATRLMGLNTLKIAAAQVAFHTTCIAPNNAKHAYVKGLALSIQHGQNYTARNCRDIDILVSDRDFEDVLMAAWKAGYNIALSEEPLRFADSAREIKFLARFIDEVKIIDANDVLIEVHRRLDKHSSVFDNEDLFANVEPFELSGVGMYTLQKPLHFVYVCYHHSRHLWSHLHWLADLDVMISSDSDPTSILEYSDKLGIRPTIEAAFQLRELISRPDLWTSVDDKDDLAAHFLKGCLSNLEGGMALEYELRETRFLHDFISESQVSPNRRQGFQQAHWSESIRPSLVQFLKRPYPSYLFWVYRLERMIIMTRDSIKSALGMKVAETKADPPSSEKRT